MSENQKCLNLIRGGGGAIFKMSEIKKSLKFPMGGVKPIWEFFPNFSVFFMMAPLKLYITSLFLHSLTYFSCHC